MVGVPRSVFLYLIFTPVVSSLNGPLSGHTYDSRGGSVRAKQRSTGPIHVTFNWSSPVTSNPKSLPPPRFFDLGLPQHLSLLLFPPVAAGKSRPRTERQKSSLSLLRSLSSTNRIYKNFYNKSIQSS